MLRWSDLPENVKREIERKYRAGKSPADLGAEYGLKPKQISDQAYRKLWDQGGKASATEKSAKKGTRGVAKKTARKGAKKSKKFVRR